MTPDVAAARELYDHCLLSSSIARAVEMILAYGAAQRAAGAAAERERLEKELEDLRSRYRAAHRQIDSDAQALAEARNPMLPNGETITVEEMFRAWQAAEAKARDASPEGPR